MTGVDTNVLVRYIVQDDAAQAALATRFIEQHCSKEHRVFVNNIVLCELVWVLEDCYNQGRTAILSVLDKLPQINELALEDPDIVRQAVEDFRTGQADFSDSLLARSNLAKGCELTMTFDKQAAASPGFRLMK